MSRKTSTSERAQKARIERERAKKAREGYLRAKRRSEIAKAGWKTRKSDPASLYRQMVRAIERYKDSGMRRDYTRYRTIKRWLYKAFPPQRDTSAIGESFLPGVAYNMARDACSAAGWEIGVAMKFAKMS